MRCPKCKYEPTLAEQASSKDQCPSCGIFYAKYIAQLKAKLSSEPAVKVAPPEKAAPYKPAVQKHDAQPVVVVDIQMRFWSMVVFMVKWAFAAIPALIIIAVIITIISMFSVGFISGLSSGSKVSSHTDSSVDSVCSWSKVEAKTPVAQPELISAALLDKGFATENYRESNTLKISFENKSGRDVRAFEGFAVLSDLLGNQIKRVKLSDNDPRWEGNKLLWAGSIQYNQFMQDDIRLKDTSFDSLKMSFELKKILYADGELQEF